MARHTILGHMGQALSEVGMIVKRQEVVSCVLDVGSALSVRL